MRWLYPLFVAAAIAVAVPARAEPAGDDGVDFDGDGDIDDDDRTALDEAEQIVIEDRSEGLVLAESARAVTVVDLREARKRSADLGEVLARTHGIAVRRAGGLGSDARLSLNGLNDEQIRLFLDGVPLHLAGWELGFANIPVSFVSRIDVYRGVVPIALGADALGGAIDMVTDPSWVSRGALSYEVGSFGTHRAAASARARDNATGLAVGISSFIDHSRNDYPIRVEVPDDRGQLAWRTVRRFHDAYTAAGAIGELGVVDRGPLTRAVVRTFHVQYAKELQHNAVMTIPYGDAGYGGTTRGGSLDTWLELGGWHGRLVAGATRTATRFRDLTAHIYGWEGDVVGERMKPGEVGEASDQQLRTTDAFARATLERDLGPRHRVRLAVAPTWTRRTGRDFLDANPDGRDPIQARRDVSSLVTGVEHELTALGGRLHNIAAAKYYRFASEAEDPRPEFTFVLLSTTTQRLGVSDSARFALTPELLLKASYEWATRLPTPSELFGDGVLSVQNLSLRPENSHNLNAGAQLGRDTRLGAWSGEVAGFARLVENLIVPISTRLSTQYYNVYGARIVGVEGAGGWTAPGGWASLRLSATLQDLRNSSSEGSFGEFAGDRLPNRPWLFGALDGSLRRRGTLRADDEVVLFGTSRYVRQYLRGWESAGRPEYKQEVPSQLVHGLGVGYALRNATPVEATFELQNLLDARVYDSFGVQRPGRAVFFKISIEQ